MYKIKVNDQYTFDIEDSKTGIIVNNEPVVLDTLVAGGNAHILYKNKSFNVELVSRNEDKTVTVKVNGSVYSVAVQDRFDQLLQQLGMDNLSAGKIKELKAPMPGLVLSILVKEGQEVKKGDNLLVLEAMKMENILKSPTDGLIRKILIKTGAKLEKNTVLIQFD